MLELVGQTEPCVYISMKNIEMRNGVVFILVRLSRGGSVGYDGQQSGSHKDWSVRGWTGRKGKCYVCTIMYCGYEKIILQVAVMSYSAKFASTFYGPFRCLACLRARQHCVL